MSEATFTTEGSAHARFNILGMTFKRRACTESSLTFDVFYFNQCGWCDVHYPCRGHIKLWISAALPNEFLQAEKLRELIAALIAELNIPTTETYEAQFCAPTPGFRMAQPVNQEGMTDRLICKTQWKLPET